MVLIGGEIMDSSSGMNKLLKTIKSKFKKEKLESKDKEANKFVDKIKTLKETVSGDMEMIFKPISDFFKDKKEKLKEIELLKNINFDKIDEEKTLKLGLTLTALVLMGLAVNVKTTAYDVKLSSEDIGIVRRQEDLELVLEELKDELSSTYNMDVVLNEEVEMEKVHVLDDKITPLKEIKTNVKNKMNFLVQGYTLEIDGEVVGALKTKDEIEKVLARIKEPFEKDIEENAKIEKIEVLEDIKIKKSELPYYQVSSADRLYERLMHGGKDVKIHEVEVGESLWTIAQIYNTTMDELIEANKDKDPDKLQIGDEIKLVSSKPLLTVATIAEVNYDEVIEFESEVETDGSRYNNEKEVKVEGKEGKALVIAKETRHNGVTVSKNELKREIIEEPVKEVIIQGTKEVPRTVATGSFVMPTRGRISSRYGMRNGRMHRGLDIAASNGTPINAADGGTVVYSGYSGAYGNLIEIDHGNGYRTKYAHCSKLLVSKGDKVYKGQHIANVGNTGRSTGPHLHLEVLKNGSNQNPSSYVN